MLKLRDIAALLLVAACSGPGTTERGHDVLRISIAGNVSTIDLSNINGGIADFLDLVYRPASAYFASATVAEGQLKLIPKSSVHGDLGALAAKVRAPGVQGFHPSGDVVEAALPPGQSPPTLADIVVDDGPFEQASLSADKLVLKRRSGSGLQAIEILGTSGKEEEWRRLLAGDVDVVPASPPGDLRYLAEIPSVRIVPVEHPPTSGLLFNVTGPIFSDARLRRAVGLALRRQAIANAVTGDPSAAVNVDEDGVEAQALLANAHPVVRLLLWSPISDDQRAAMVVEQQLEEVGFRVAIRVVDLDEGLALVAKRDFDALLLFAGFEPLYFRRALSGNRANITGYSNPEFDAAVAVGDENKAIAILERDVPFTPLYRVNEGVAMNPGFCNVHPKVDIDLSWLADVHACADGETQ